MKPLFRIVKQNKQTTNKIISIATPDDFQPLRAKKIFGFGNSSKQPQGPEKSSERLKEIGKLADRVFKRFSKT